MATSLAYPSGEEGDNFSRSNDFYLPSLYVEEGGGESRHPVVATGSSIGTVNNGTVPSMVCCKGQSAFHVPPLLAAKDNLSF